MMRRMMERKLDGIRNEIRHTEALVAAKRSKAAKLNDPIARKTVARDRFKLERELDSLRAQERRLEQGIF
jgi:predicted  nucleic acid-binding Zn-ribbon protein